jgi:hypothetical protein
MLYFLLFNLIMRSEFVAHIANFKLDDEDSIGDPKLIVNITREIRLSLKNYYWPKGRVAPIIAEKKMVYKGEEIVVGYVFNGMVLDFNPQKYFDRVEPMLPIVDGNYYLIDSSRVEGTLVFDKYVAKGLSDIATMVEFVKQISKDRVINMVHVNFLTGIGKLRRSFKHGRLESAIDYYEDEMLVKHGSDADVTDNKFAVDPEEFEISYTNDQVYGGGKREIPVEKYSNLILKDYFNPEKSPMSCAYNVVWYYYKNILKVKDGYTLATIKKQFNVHEEATIHDIRTFCNTLGVPVNCIYGVYHEYEEGVLNILFENAHAYYVAGVSKVVSPKDVKAKKQKEAFDVYVTFDFETITDENNEAVPYAFSFAATGDISNYNFSPESEREVIVEHFDPNTDKFCSHVKYGMGSKCLGEFERFVWRANKNNWNLLMYGFNNAKFDNMLMLKYFKRYRKDRNYTIFRDVQVTNNQYRSMKIFSNKVHDMVYMLSPNTLKNHTGNFKCSPEKLESDKFTHGSIQALYDLDSEKFIKEVQCVPDLTLYSKYDVVSLLSLMSRYSDGMNAFTKSLNGTEFYFKSSPHTAGALAWSLFKSVTPHSLEALPEELDKIVRENMVGGRTCLFKFKENKLKEMISDDLEILRNTKGQYIITTGSKMLTYVDYCSLYPTVMFCQKWTEAIMGSSFKLWPTSNAHTRGNSLVEPFIAECAIDQSNLFHPIICPKGDGLTHDWDSTAFIPSKWITHDEHNLLVEYGCKVTVKQTINFTDSATDLWNRFIKTAFEIKKQEDFYKETGNLKYNASLRELAKLIINSVSGKPSQRNFESSSEFVGSDSQKAEFITRHKYGTIDFHNIREDVCVATGDKEQAFDPDKAYPSYLSMFIYGKARMLMYKTLINPQGLDIQPIYSDTDSMILTAADLERVKAKFPEIFFTNPLDKDLGTIDIEYADITKVWLFNKKDYAYRSHKKGLNLKLKGVTAMSKDKKPVLIDMWIRPVKDETFDEVPVPFDRLPEILKLGVYVISDTHKLYGDMMYDGSVFAMFRVKTVDNATTITECRFTASLQKMDETGLDFRFKAMCVNLNVFTVKKHWRDSTITYKNVSKAIK